MTQAVQPTSVEFDLPITGPATVPWRYLAATEHVIEWIDAAGNVISAGTINADFAISPTGNTLAHVGVMTLLSTPPAAAASVRLSSQTTPRQDYAAPSASGKGIEAQMDRQVRVLQELRAQMAGTLRVSGSLSPFQPVPGGILAFDENNHPVVLPPAAVIPVPPPADPALFQMLWLDDLPTLLANTTLTMTAGQPGSVALGDWIGTRKEGFSFQVAAADAVTHDRITAGGIKLYGKGAADQRVYANANRAINYFDFVDMHYASAQKEQIANGGYAGDQATALGAFHAAVMAAAAARTHAHCIFPSSTIRHSNSLNWAADHLRIETQGRVEMIGIGAVRGFSIDGMGLGQSTQGVVGMRVDPILASTETGGVGCYIRRLIRGEIIGPQSAGGSFAGVLMDGCQVTTVRKGWMSTTARAPFLQVPEYAFVVTGTAWQPGDYDPQLVYAPGHPQAGQPYIEWKNIAFNSWCLIEAPVMEAVPIGVSLDHCYGNTIFCGTSERNSNGGLVLAQTASQNLVMKTDFEVNTNDDIICRGFENTFLAVDSGGRVRFIEGAHSNNVIGGKYPLIEFDASTYANYVDDSVKVGTITDLSNNPKRNRWLGTLDFDGNRRDRLIKTAVAVTPGTGSLGANAATISVKNRADGETVEVYFIHAITTNGTGAGWLQFNLPFTPSEDFSLAGHTTVAGVKRSVVGQGVAGSPLVTITVYDGSYPGGSATTINLQGACIR